VDKNHKGIVSEGLNMSFHVRRKDREITDLKDLQRVLKATKYVTIALCMDNEPYLVSLSHGYDEAKECLYFHCAPEGKKLVFAKANNKIWGQAVMDFGVTEDCDYAYTSVQFSGTLSLVEDLSEKKHAMKTLVRQVSLNPEEKLASLDTEKLARTSMGRINITYMSGKKHLRPKRQQ
jgi:nitroimidazol reductase NimA-like FMN-containing flavoprotein (pyridoxamine 5'-phosphate oxidase superfamily)